MEKTMLNTMEKNLSSPQLRELEKFGNRVKKLGVNFAVCSVSGELLLLCNGNKFESDTEQLAKLSLKALNQKCGEDCVGTGVQVCQLSKTSPVLATVLKSAPIGNNQGEAAGIALIDLGNGNVRRDTKDQTQDTILSEMLTLLAETFQVAAKAEGQIEMVGAELSQVYEELVLLHKLSANMKVTEPDASFLQMSCDNLTDIVFVEGIAILLEKTIGNDKQLSLVAGSGLIDINEQTAAVLHNRLTEEINKGREALLDSEVDSPFRFDWPNNIRNIIAVPLYGKDKTKTNFAEKTQNSNSVIGLMVAINRIDKPDFDSYDVKLFNSVASSCAVFVENGRLFKDIKELFIGSLKALTSSIDAKDPYTRGHSERVAFISRWIAEKLAEEEPLGEEQVHRIYLGGLLHDIGKMGISETVLCKEGKLTEQEFDHIRTHPSIGAGILNGIKQMHDIVPGILCHHERIDGRGYPNGLAGEKIPLIGKIIGLADSFDAMTSKRVYREAMTVKEALEEIEKGLGTQFDEKVGKVFINSDVYQLWDIIQDGFSKIYGTDNFSEYGAVAVGTLIR